MENPETNYPGKGLNAAVQAFNAYKFAHERQRELSPEDWVGYDKLVIEYDAEQRRIERELHGGRPNFLIQSDRSQETEQEELDRISRAIRPHHSRSPREGYN